MVPLWLRQSDADPANASPYFSLSHCWGSAAFLTLNSSASTQLRHGIHMSELSQTFQDAIYIANQLGSKFIWIDSLCIFQDSAEDWQKESITMADIYGGSRCNIAAAAATDTNAWFLRTLDPHRLESLLVHSSWKNVANDNYHILPQTYWRYRVQRGPLLSRGCVQQECLLAPRILYFISQQIFWNCYSTSACEPFPTGVTEWIRMGIMSTLFTVQLPKATIS
jgi:hypothetical protein